VSGGGMRRLERPRNSPSATSTPTAPTAGHRAGKVVVPKSAGTLTRPTTRIRQAT